MEKKILDILVEESKVLMNAQTCCEDAKNAAQAWLDAVGTEKEAEQSKAYVEVLEDAIVPIDDLIALAQSEKGIQYFGEETAKGIVLHGKEIKAAGAQYCDCPACAAVEKILKYKDILLNQ